MTRTIRMYMIPARVCRARRVPLRHPASYWRSFMRKFFTVLAALASLSLTNCGYNAIQQNDESVKSSWSEVVNQYQRRADLVQNLVN